MQMVIYMRESGEMIKPMAKETTCMLMAPNTREIGRMISSMV